MSIGRGSDHRYGVLAIAGLLCVCVFAQILGMPATLISLFTSSEIIAEETVMEEDLLLTPVVPELATARSSRLCVRVQPSPQPALFMTSVFHPPKAES